MMFMHATAKERHARIITESGYSGCIELSNDSVRVVLEPNFGGRVIAYERTSRNVLYLDEKQDGEIYRKGKYQHPTGGRFDIGPEKTIPPHPALFLGKWTARITGPGEAEMTSQKDTSTGVQLIRRFKLGASGSKLVYTQIIKNISDSSKTYCHWSRTFARGGGIGFAPVNPHSRYPAQYLIYGPGNIMNFMPDKEKNIRIREGILEITDTPSLPKIVTDALDGWLAYLTPDNLLFIKKYRVDRKKIYGEMAASTACLFYKPTYCEIEPIGPMQEIAPGRQVSFTECWYLFDYKFPEDRLTNLGDLQRIIKRLSFK